MKYSQPHAKHNSNTLQVVLAPLKTRSSSSSSRSGDAAEEQLYSLSPLQMKLARTADEVWWPDQEVSAPLSNRVAIKLGLLQHSPWRDTLLQKLYVSGFASLCVGPFVRWPIMPCAISFAWLQCAHVAAAAVCYCCCCCCLGCKWLHRGTFNERANGGRATVVLPV